MFSVQNKLKYRFNNKLLDRFSSIYDFCSGDINKFILLLRKGVYPYEYMGSFEQFSDYHCLIKMLFIAT